MYKVVLRKACISLAVLVAPMTALASDAGLRVTVTDNATQRPLPNANIQVVSRENQMLSGTTNSDGELKLDDLKPGLYELRVERESYQGIRLPSLRLTVDKVTPVNISMTVAGEQIGEVLVLGTSVGFARLNSLGTSVLDRESLRSAAGSGSDVLRALDGLPGLFSSGEFSSFTVRGNGPRDNLILVDGVPFDRVVHFSDSFGELEDAEGGGRYSVFAPNIVGSAEFQPGGWGPAYGGRAGSLLKLDVAEGNPDSASYTARLDFAGLEVGYDGPSGIHDDTSLLFSARQLDFGRFFDMIGIEDIGSPELTDVIVKTRTDFASGDSLKFLAIYAPESYERDIDNVLASDEDNPGSYEDTEIVESEADNMLFVGTWNKLIGSTGELTNQLYYRHYGEESRSGEANVDGVTEQTPVDTIPIRFPIVSAERDETEIGWRLDYSYDNTLGRFETGLRATQTDLEFSRALDDDWILYEFEQNDFRPDIDQKYIVLSPERTNTQLDDSATQVAAYVDQNFSLGSWDFRAGLRVDNDQLIDDTQISPRAAATWQLNDKTNINLTAGRYLQTPRFEDIASDPNNQLTFEIIDQVSLGMKYRLNSDIDLFIEPYYQSLTDRVVEQDGVNQTFANTGEGTAYGFDTAITRYFSNGWSANATYSYNDTRLKDSPDGEEYEADYSRPHAASLGGIWEINETWKLSGRLKWASGSPFGEFIIHENVLGDGEPLRYSKEIITNNTERYDSYTSINVRLDFRQTYGPVDVIAFLDIINLTGAANPSSAEFNERTGENVIEDGETFPLIGLRLEW